MFSIRYGVLLLWVALLFAGCQWGGVQPDQPQRPPATAEHTRALPAQPPLLSARQREALLEDLLDNYSNVPQAPKLRIETGAHLRAIHALALDSEGRYLATASVDRTVRIWNPENGELQATLRPPAGFFYAGTTFAMDFAPGGQVLAASGLTFFPRPVESLSNAGFIVYFFDLDRQKVVRTLSGIPGRVHDLAYSRDGRYLAVAYGSEVPPGMDAAQRIGKSGFAVYHTSGLQKMYDVGTEMPCQWLDFDIRGRLIALCQGSLLTFEGERLVKLRAAGADPYHSAALSPDGRSLAVSHQDSPRVDLLRVDDLTLERSLLADQTGIGRLSLAWSPGGAYLYGAGRRDAGDGKDHHSMNNRLFKWQVDGQAPPTSIELGRMDVLAIVGGRDGRIILGSDDAMVRAVDSTDRLFTLVHSGTIDSDNRPGALWASADGLRFAYSDDNAAQNRYVFSLEKRTLLPWDEAKDTAQLRPANPSGRPVVENWQRSTRVVCGDGLLDLGGDESQNLAYAADGSGFAIGTDKGVLFFDPQCRRVWSTVNQARTVALAMAEEQGLVLAQDEAGVIRLLRRSDGHKLLSFFPSRLGKAWALWTPENFYDASPRGESLVGWHINRDRHREALFYGAGRFRDLFHSSQQINASLGELSPAQRDIILGQALELAETLRERLPPKVRILAIDEGMDASGPLADVRFSLSTPGGEREVRVRALINGRPVGMPTTFEVEGEDIEARIALPVPAEASQLELIAETALATSDPATASLRQSLLPTQATGGYRPKLYALVVGIGDYQDPRIPDLDFSAKDARDFAAKLRAQAGQLYSAVEIRLLTDGIGTRESIVDGLEWLRRQATARDVAIVFLAGHGVNDNLNRYFFLPSSASLDRLSSTAVSNADISAALRTLPSKALAFLDTCHAGNVLGSGINTRGIADIDRLVNEFSSAENGIIVFASSTGMESSMEHEDWGNGAFTKALKEGLDGKADFNFDSVVSLSELDLWLSERVKELTDGEQHPNMLRPQSIRDFPFSLVRRGL